MKRNGKLFTVMLFVAVFMILPFSMEAYGSTDADIVYEVKLAASKYAYTGEAIAPEIKVTDSKGNTLVEGTDYHVEFTNNVDVGIASVVVTFTDEDVEAVTERFVIVPPAPTSASAVLYGHDDVKFSWSKVDGASGYLIYYKKSTSDSYTCWGRTSGTSIEKTDLTDGAKYYFKVVPYYNSGEVSYASLSSKSASVYTLKQMNVSTVKKYSSSQVTVGWKDIYGQSGYQISRSTSNTGINVIFTYATESGTSKVVSSGTKGRPYYYRVRAYKRVTIDGKTKTVYGPWSAAVKYTMQLAAPTSASAVLYGHDDVKFSWSEVSGASGYFVYYKKSTSDSYAYWGRTTGTSIKKTNLTDGVKYYFKAVPYLKVGDTRYNSSNYKTASVTTLKQVTIKEIATKGSKVKVKWSNISGETGYQISRSTKKGGTNIVATYATTGGNYKRVSATRKQNYYYKVRAYKKVTVDGKTKTVYGPWSAVKKYKRTSSYTTGYESVMDSDIGNSMVLVNKEYAVSESYYPINMVTIKKSIATYSGMKVKSLAYDAYLEMLEDARKAGHDFYICSAYRSFEMQENLYENSLKANGKKYTEKMFAYPDTSEHHTGYAIDVTSKSMGWGLKQNFTDYPDGAWITKNCAKYGFIIRYPKGKTNITGYTYEPWHLRYVGKTVAKEIMSKGITLEEYLGAA